MTAVALTVFPSTDASLACIRERVISAHKRECATVAGIPDIVGIDPMVKQIDVVGHKHDGFLRFGVDLIRDTPNIRTMLTQLHAKGITTVRLLGCEIGAGNAQTEIENLAQAVGITILGTRRQLDAKDFGHTGLLLGVEARVFGSVPSRPAEPSFRLDAWVRAHPQAQVRAELINEGQLATLLRYLSDDYLLACIDDADLRIDSSRSRRFRVSVAGVQGCFQLVGSTGERLYVLAESGGSGDPAVDVLYPVKEGHETEVQKIIGSLPARSGSPP